MRSVFAGPATRCCLHCVESAPRAMSQAPSVLNPSWHRFHLRGRDQSLLCFQEASACFGKGHDIATPSIDFCQKTALQGALWGKRRFATMWPVIVKSQAQPPMTSVSRPQLLLGGLVSQHYWTCGETLEVHVFGENPKGMLCVKPTASPCKLTITLGTADVVYSVQYP
eukprot:1161226-Pelagomonas_calceolata.AAC.9